MELLKRIKKITKNIVITQGGISSIEQGNKLLEDKLEIAKNISNLFSCQGGVIIQGGVRIVCHTDF